MKIIVKSDVFDLSSRVKDIDSNYTIFFDTKSNNFVLYYGNQYALNLGKILDARVINKIYYTRVENSIDIFNEIEKNNLKIQKENEETQKYMSSHKLKQILSFADSHSKDYIHAQETTWV